MMASVHEIGIGAETRGFDDQFKRGVIKPVEDAVEAFKDLEAATSDAARDGSRDLDKLEAKLRDVQTESGKTERSFDDIGDVGGRGFRKLGDAGEEVSGELRQNLGETFSSFRGDLEDLPQVAQDVFGGLAGSVGGLGGALALAGGAAGIGLIIAGFDQINEAAEKSRERVDSWAGSFTEAGAKLLSASIVQGRMNEILTDTGGQLKQASENAERWGTSQEDAVLAMAGHQPTIDKIRDSLDEQGQAFVDLARKGEGLTSQQSTAFAEYQRGSQAFRELSSEMAAGATVIDVQSAALKNLIDSTSGATEEVDELGNRLISLPEGEEIFIDAQTGVATQNIERFKGDVDGAVQPVTKKVSVEVQDNATGQMDQIIQRLQGRTVQVGIGTVLKDWQ